MFSFTLVMFTLPAAIILLAFLLGLLATVVVSLFTRPPEDAESLHRAMLPD